MAPGVDLNINDDVWTEFQKLILDENNKRKKEKKEKISASKDVENYMKRRVEESKNRNI